MPVEDGTLRLDVPDALRSARDVRTERAPDRAHGLRRLLMAADVAAVLIAFTVVDAVPAVGGSADAWELADLLLLVVGLGTWTMLAGAYGLYHLHSRRVEHGAADEAGPVLQMTALWGWILLLAGWGGVDRLTVDRVAPFCVLAAVLLLALRSVARAVARRRSWWTQRTLVLGCGPQGSALAAKLRRHPEYGLEMLGCVELSDAAPAPIDGVVPPAVCPEDVPCLVQLLGVHRVILAGEPTDQIDAGRRFDVARELSERLVRVDLVPSWFEVLGTRLEVQELEGTSLLTVPYVRLGTTARAAKRTFDIVVAGVALVAVAPLLAMCAAAIRLDTRGPVFFRQPRVGKDGKPFGLLKFRSMHVDADARKHEVAALNLHGGGHDGPGMFKVRADPRVTRIGRLLRRTSLDELPQLLNIVRGDMSIVGPRPLIEQEDRQVEGRYRRRLELTPGMTGLWQVNGRSEVPFEAMVNLDYLYVTTWSLWGDMKILLKTVPAVLARRGAY